jgi:hypothetical protein
MRAVRPKPGSGARDRSCGARGGASLPTSELLHEGIPLPLIQRQLGHSHRSTTGTYLQGISAPYKSSSAVSDVSLVQFGSRIVRAMHPYRRAL